MIDLFPDRTAWASTYVPESSRVKTWADFTCSTDERRQVLQAINKFVDDAKHGYRQPLWLYGATGVGKTLLVTLAWMELAPVIGDRRDLRQAVYAGTADNICWISGSSLPAIIRPPAQPDAQTLPTINHVNSAYLCVLDDLDKCPPGWSGGIFQIIDGRLSAGIRPTIITTNASPRQFVRRYQDHGLPIYDRLRRTGAVIVHVPKDPTASSGLGSSAGLAEAGDGKENGQPEPEAWQGKN